MRVFIIKILMKRCFAHELREIIRYGEELVFNRISQIRKG